MIDARLHVTRVHEVKVLSGVAEEIDALDRVTMTQGGLHGVGTLLRRYSSLRKRKAARIIALV